VPEEALGEQVGAFVVELLGRLPRGGDKVELARNATAEITALSRRRVTRMRVELRKAPPPGEGDSKSTEP
jgi:Mg2+/Co2+ transporter CorC